MGNRVFSMPSGLTITGRSSSIRNAFVAAIIPAIQPNPEDIGKVLAVLGMQPDDVRCSYCGDKATEWDHLRPLVVAGRPTGYPHSIQNLVPSCGKCNQSKGNKPWKTWMVSKAVHSPANRGIPDVAARIERLEANEKWAACEPLDIEAIVDSELWARYFTIQNDVLGKMVEAQRLASQIKEQVVAGSVTKVVKV
jgi:HNH endonuclease